MKFEWVQGFVTQTTLQGKHLQNVIRQWNRNTELNECWQWILWCCLFVLAFKIHTESNNVLFRSHDESKTVVCGVQIIDLFCEIKNNGIYKRDMQLVFCFDFEVPANTPGCLSFIIKNCRHTARRLPVRILASEESLQILSVPLWVRHFPPTVRKKEIAC